MLPNKRHLHNTAILKPFLTPPIAVKSPQGLAGGGDFRSPRTAPSAPRQHRGLATESGTGAHMY
jgi:hypothetical protein